MPTVDHVSIIREYKAKIEAELFEIYVGIVKLIDEKLVLATKNKDSKVFYLKMKGDYHRYLAEFKIGDDRKAAAEHTLTAYKSSQVHGNFSNSLRSCSFVCLNLV